MMERKRLGSNYLCKMENNISRTQKVAKNMIWETIQSVVTALLPFFIRSLVIRQLGEEYLGLQSFCTSILDILNVSNLGIDTALLSHIHRPLIENDTKKINEILNFYNKIYRYMGIGVCVIALGIMPFLNKLIARDIPSDVNIYYVFSIYLICFLLYYLIAPSSVFLLKARQQSYKVSKLVTICFVAQNIAQIVFVLMKNYYGYIMVILINTIVLYTLEYFTARREFPQYHYDNTVSLGSNGGFIRDTISVFVYGIRDLSRNSADSVVISAILGLNALAKYQNYYMVMLVPKMLRDVLINAATPSLGNFSVSSRKEDVYEMFLHLLYMQMLISSTVSIFYIVLVDDFVNIWLGREFILERKMGILFAVYLYVMGITGVCKMVRSAMGFWERGKIIAVVETIANLILNVVLTLKFGLAGIVLATIGSILIINIPAEMFIVIRKSLKQKMGQSIRVMVKNVIWTVTTVMILLTITRKICCGIWMNIMLKVAITIVIMTVTYIVFYVGDKENKFLLRIIKNIIH